MLKSARLLPSLAKSERRQENPPWRNAPRGILCNYPTPPTAMESPYTMLFYEVAEYTRKAYCIRILLVDNNQL